MDLRRAIVASLVAFGSSAVACDAGQPVTPGPEGDDEQARMVQCCQGVAHEAWNSDPPNAMVLHAARACEAFAREGALELAREELSAAGHATTCDACPPNGCRPRDGASKHRQ